MITGLLLIAAALGLVVYNKLDSARADREAGTVIDEMEAVIEENSAKTDTEEYRREEAIREDQGEMAAETIGKYEYIGSLEFPSLGIVVPVTSEWSYARLKIAACRYTGSYYDNDLVICAHNYDHFFAKIRWIPIGDDVIFTTVNGRELHYIVVNRETLQPTAIETMVDTAADWDLTLFTCNGTGQTRCAVRCELAD